MREFMKSKGIDHRTSPPFTPQINGTAERENRTIVEAARTMLIAKDLPMGLWAEATLCAVYLNNGSRSHRV